MASVAQLIRMYARQYGVDPRAALAVASVEGGLRTGAVGDQGTSYGPFQLHAGGALPRGRGADWANSPQGIAYALQRMAASGAQGLHGRAAVEAIVRNFERPADPSSEVTRAFAAYGGNLARGTGGQAGSIYSGSGAPVASQGAARTQLLQQLIASSQQRNPSYSGVISALGQLGKTERPPTELPSNARPDVSYEVHGHVDAHVKRAIQVAESFVGTPYQWGGAKPGGFDCSGLLYYAWGRQGIQIPRTSEAQWKYGRPVPLDRLRPGDAVFFHMGSGGPGHVAMYIGAGKMLESPHTGARVRIVPLRHDAVGARRFR